ncbi:MAG: alanine racemase [Candidatus Eiseniibacteriota bacterium]|jgi:alanine racemase
MQSIEFPTWAEIDLDNLRANLLAIRRHIGGRRILLVVKADAYGHGAVVVATEAMRCGIDMLGVATVHEGAQLRRAGIMAPVLVLSPCLRGEVEEIVRYGLRCTISSPEFLDRLARECELASVILPVQMEVDTGMGRSGVAPEAVPELIEAIRGHARLRLEGLYTHFPDADAADLDLARRQLERFLALVASLEAEGRRPELLHAANSAGLVNLPAAHLDMVRPGLLAYGLRPGGPAVGATRKAAPPAPATVPDVTASGAPPVVPVMAFCARLLQIRDLPRGASISYGRTFVAPRPMRIGVVAAGYGHGLGLEMSGRGLLLVRGGRVPILGRVTMDMTMVDLTDRPDVQPEDEVIIFGRRGDAMIHLEEVAAWCGTIPYEIMCSIGKRVPRVYVEAGRTVQITTLIGERRRRASDEPAAVPIPAPALRAPGS